MNSMVIITTGETSKRHFANALHRLSGGKVSLVVIQRFKRKSPKEVWGKTLERVGWLGLPSELAYYLICKLNPKIRQALGYFRERTLDETQNGHYVPQTFKTYSINSPETESAIRKANPSLIVIWGGSIIKKNILALAPKIINMHFGWCPEYRGSNGNQNAILAGDMEHVGITIHYVKEKVDTGDILARVRADLRIPPREMFRNINNSAAKTYMDIALRLFRSEKVDAQPQNLSEGKTYFFRDWSYKKEYLLAQKLIALEKKIKG